MSADATQPAEPQRGGDLKPLIATLDRILAESRLFRARLAARAVAKHSDPFAEAIAVRAREASHPFNR